MRYRASHLSTRENFPKVISIFLCFYSVCLFTNQFVKAKSLCVNTEFLQFHGSPVASDQLLLSILSSAQWDFVAGDLTIYPWPCTEALFGPTLKLRLWKTDVLSTGVHLPDADTLASQTFSSMHLRFCCENHIQMIWPYKEMSRGLKSFSPK